MQKELKPNSQLFFAVKMVKKYREETGKPKVGVRRLHYFIVSLPENERLIPSKNGLRPYENTLNEYKRLSRLLTEARVNGFIDWDWIIDEKNEPLIEMPPREDLTVKFNYYLGDLGYIPYIESTRKMKDFTTFLENIEFQANVKPPRFKHQTHRLVIAIEKATNRERLEEIAQKYGADLLIFSGQFSVTRVNDVVKRAREENKPIALFYISDLDCAGWFMPPAFFRRIQEIYPREDHIMIRVALTREQAEKFNLPEAFDPDTKGYSETQKQRFIMESGGRACIELDALNEDTLIDLLEEKLEEWANLQEDEEEYEEVLEEAEKTAKQLKEELDLTDIQEEYETTRKEFNQIVEKIQNFVDELEGKIKEAQQKQRKLAYKIREKLQEIVENVNGEW